MRAQHLKLLYPLIELHLIECGRDELGQGSHADYLEATGVVLSPSSSLARASLA